MNIIDISAQISEDMTVYKNKVEKKPKITTLKTIKDGAQESRISIDSHTGTHVDAPKHIVAGGKGLEAYPLASFVGPCRVIDLSSCEGKIGLEDVKKISPKIGERLLFKTKNSDDIGFNGQFVYVDAAAAQFLVKQRVSLIGIDSLGIERDQPGHETHAALLKANIAILEGLRLKGVKAGSYTLFAAPLAIKGIDAAPCRALLLA